MASDIEAHLGWLKEHAKGTVLEIGVRDGHSTAALISGVEENGGHVFSVDSNENVKRFVNGNWTFIHADSLKNPEFILNSTGRLSNGLWIDLLFLDGDHTYAGCMSDLTNFGKYAKIIAVHDTESSFSGVWEAVIAYYRCEWNRPFVKAEFFNKCFGLGVLYR